MNLYYEFGAILEKKFIDLNNPMLANKINKEND